MTRKRIKIRGACTAAYEPAGLHPDDDEPVDMTTPGPTAEEQDEVFVAAMRAAIKSGGETVTEGFAKLDDLHFSVVRIIPPASIMVSRSVAADCAEWSGGAGKQVRPSGMTAG